MRCRAAQCAPASPMASSVTTSTQTSNGCPCLARLTLVNDRPYRARKTVEEALATLRAGAGRQWDPAVVDVFAAGVPELSKLGAA